MSQSSDSKFEAYSFSVPLKVLLTVRDVTDVYSLDAIHLVVWARLPKCKSHFFLIPNISGDVSYVNFDKR